MLPDGMCYEMDPRIKYLRCRSGDPSGTLYFSENVNGNKSTKQVSWHHPMKSELAAINEMEAFIKQIGKCYGTTVTRNGIG